MQVQREREREVHVSGDILCSQHAPAALAPGAAVPSNMDGGVAQLPVRSMSLESVERLNMALEHHEDK